MSSIRTRVGLALLTIVLTLLAAGSPIANIPNSLAGQYSPASTSLDTFGGHPGLSLGATGFFRAQQAPGGRWWLVDPLGNAYFANGVSLITPDGISDIHGSNPYAAVMRSKYGNPVNTTAWASDVEDRLRSWGYNSAGSWSSSSLYSRLPHTVELSPINAAVRYVNPSGDWSSDTYPIIYEVSRPDWDAQYRRHFFDVFNPIWEQEATNHIVSTINSNGYAGEQNLLGYFADNEVPLWYGRCITCTIDSPWYTSNTLADVFIDLPATAEGKIAWVDFLREKYHNSISELNSAWGGTPGTYSSFDQLLAVRYVPNGNAYRENNKLEFLQRIVRQYFSTIRNAIRSVDSSHLYLGNRFVTGAVSTPYGVYVEAGSYQDVVSVNYYIWDNLSYSAMKSQMDTALNVIATQSQKPLMITEFSFAAVDSGMPATVTNGALVATQEQRAQLYANYRRIAAESLKVVGLFWWSYFDPPSTGSSVGGENSNLGLVNNSDNPYLRMLYPVYQQNSSLYTYRGLTATTGPILSNARATSAFTIASADEPSIVLSDPTAGAPQDASASAAIESSPLVVNRVYLPLVLRNTRGLPQTTFSFTLASPVTGATIDIYDGVQPSAVLKRRLTLPAMSAGNQSYLWDGFDQDGFIVGTGSFYFVIKVSTGAGLRDYAMVSFVRQ